MPSEQDGDAFDERLIRVAHLRVLVGYLGEKAQHGWWPSEFYSATSSAFLTPVFVRTAKLAQYHGASEAARLVHDEHIGIGRVFHLFRLPQAIEQAVFEYLQVPAAAEEAQRGIASADEAMSVLQVFFDSPPLSARLVPSQLDQLFFLYTSRANLILADFVREVYWRLYAAGSKLLSADDAKSFVQRAIDDGKTPSRWAEGQVERVGRYLTGCCADYGLLGDQTPQGRPIIPYRLQETVAAYLAYDPHFSGHGDNSLSAHPDWQLFGLSRDDVRDELKRLSLNGHIILQSAGDIMHIGWKHKSMEGFLDVLAQG